MSAASIHSLTTQIANLIVVTLVVAIPFYGLCRKRLDIYPHFVEGAQEGFEIAIRIIPHLVAMLVAIGMLQASGFFTLMAQALHPLLASIGVDSDLVSLGLLRPFSGSASNALLNQIAHDHGGDSLVAKTAATLIGSTETTFYVLAVYFGSVSIKRTRYALPVGLTADFSGMVAAIVICQWLLG